MTWHCRQRRLHLVRRKLGKILSYTLPFSCFGVNGGSVLSLLTEEQVKRFLFYPLLLSYNLTLSFLNCLRATCFRGKRWLSLEWRTWKTAARSATVELTLLCLLWIVKKRFIYQNSLGSSRRGKCKLAINKKNKINRNREGTSYDRERYLDR